MGDHSEQVFLDDVAAAAFQLGIYEARWRIEMIEWPHAIISIQAQDGRWIAHRFELKGYPSAPPTGKPWNFADGSPLSFDLWPKSRQAGGRVSSVYKPNWENGNALYIPCDRITFNKHKDWPRKYPTKLWKPELGIACYLEQVHELLNCSDYQTEARAAA